ncbi:methylated-DNA--[protein]-cysteine S-methyltransferase [Paenibacillus radicis (ex Xue et al. 2023)]|uniref:Methylated-DNA--protein-cysteine methyltransferase n=1 Tax=Paenibacillus radicis (ex Xue et al. 2023) TaxID=2972489 RepID=A0ABT1YT34_9BACL|nr:methylated-DNA--[protein]-cysteine S-methyltransferase [Paenibacillus radicis (ex Xue et al. 2023)]MCR8636352.1 methylated-DNA--[protein]-cysteine S-methyltransferase [Paenibacillus radicis (ex Xue et al. 2023)]
MAHMSYIEMESPIGPLVLGATEKGLCHVEFGRFADVETKLQKWSGRWFQTYEWQLDMPLLREAIEQLQQYFAGDRTQFELELDLRGTPFQVKVWQALSRIPYGVVCSYKDIGQAVDSVKAVRAVGGANNQNPVPIIVPCHRVIGANGSLVGYGGGLNVKTFLLQHEGYKI